MRPTKPPTKWPCPPRTVTVETAPETLPVLVFKLAIGGALMALIETLNAKMRVFRVPEFLGTAFLMAVIGLLVNVLLGVG